MLRVILAGLVLGLLIGKLVARRPFHIDRLRPRFWRAAMRRMKRRHWVRLLTVALWVTAASIIISGVVGTLLQQAQVQTYSPEEYPFTAIERDYPWLVLIAVNALPIFEEWIFRGVMIDELVRWRGSKLLAVLVSALVFAAFHLSNPGTYLPFVLPLIPAGLLLGVCYLKTGLGGAVIAHNSYNTFLVIIGVLRR
ncbi:MAG: CPBP family intramembrane metalloprotease [Candidatus Hodarchaeaceae archaeon]|nr:CPBP family intramembrane metalloprotease [Candidatus Hodarchaeaceae archaeon]